MKFLSSYFDSKTKKTIVTLVDKNGIYIGQAKVHPDDINNINELAGCRLAQKRAWLQKLKKELYNKKIMLKTIQNLKNDIENNCSYYYNSKIQRRINLKLRDYSKQIIELEESIALLQTEIKKDIEIRDKLINRTKKDKKNK